MILPYFHYKEVQSILTICYGKSLLPKIFLNTNVMTIEIEAIK